MAEKKAEMEKITNWLEILKTTFALLVDLPGLLAFHKLFLGKTAREKLETAQAERVQKLADPKYRRKVAKALEELPPHRSRNLFRRFKEAKSKGKEERLSWCVGQILETETPLKAQHKLMELDALPDDQFDIVVDLVHDDTVQQFILFAKNYVSEHWDEYNGRARRKLKRWLKKVNDWEQREVAKAKATPPVIAVVEVLQNPLRIFAGFLMGSKPWILFWVLPWLGIGLLIWYLRGHH